MSAARPFGVETVHLDLPALVGAFTRRLHEAGVPVTTERAVQLARALALTEPVSRRRLYFTVRGVTVTERSPRATFDRVFAEVFGAGRAADELPVDQRRLVGSDEQTSRDEPPRPAAQRDASEQEVPWALGDDGGRRERRTERELPMPTVATDEEVLRAKRFDELTAAELAALYELMARLTVATPRRLPRRRRRARHGARIDLRATMRDSLRTGGDPIRLARRQRRCERRRLVPLCDMSGSMEPYARAYLQFLTCAAGTAGPAGSGWVDNEAFVFATRLTRVTRALRSRRPERAIAQAAAAAPDWSSGTRIDEALRAFNGRHGRLSAARRRHGGGAAPRRRARLRPFAAVAADDLAPGCPWRPPEPRPGAGDDEPEPWASATPVAGSSVAMPSGYGPSRGNTTAGWTRSR